jgi:hypothetical protein
LARCVPALLLSLQELSESLQKAVKAEDGSDQFDRLTSIQTLLIMVLVAGWWFGT